MDIELQLRDNVMHALGASRDSLRAFSRRKEFHDQTSQGWENMDLARDKVKARLLDLQIAVQRYVEEV